MQKILFDSLLIPIGCLIFLYSLSFDLFSQGSPGIGFQQLVGMVFGLIIASIGLRYLLLPDQSKWDWLIFVIYLSGIIFVGLKPAESFHSHQNFLLGINTFSKRDLVLNVVGFIPLGFLIPPLVGYNNKTIRLVAIAVIVSFSASLIIETIQYIWIPGRFSSAYDLASNTFGAIIGAVCYVIFRVNRYRF